MSDIFIKRIDVLVEHLQGVQKAGIKLGKRLIELGEFDLGRNLIARVFRHDQSKFFGIEFANLNGEPESEEMLKVAVNAHRCQNEHHPEYHGGIKLMGRLDVAEMVCDWYSRSSHFCTSLIEWIETVAMKTWGFTKNDEVYETIMFFVNILLDKPFKKIPRE
jgi:hypothetical protein